VRVPIYQVDAFAVRKFGGNPAAVMPLQAFLDDAVLQAIALENNLSETAFLVRAGREWHLRWFTPATEVPLCGHATLASAWVVTERLDPGCPQVVFHTLSGPLTVQRRGERFLMDFPTRSPTPAEPPAGLEAALGAHPVEVLHDRFNYLVVLDSAAIVRGLAPDHSALGRLEAAGVSVTTPGGVIVTAPGDQGYDCVSRYFAPAKGIDEDPVTGGAHCALAPFWTARLEKPEIHAYQASARGGEMICRVRGERVELEGACIFYMEGEAEV
jgi:PhzF family phenazine biosynthesis protein